jgi:hypothetical protein
LAAPPVISASGPKGTQTSAGDWPAFLAKYRFISANEQNGNYIASGTQCHASSFEFLKSPQVSCFGSNLLLAVGYAAFGSDHKSLSG